jgi:hypothetical protein
MKGGRRGQIHRCLCGRPDKLAKDAAFDVVRKNTYVTLRDINASIWLGNGPKGGGDIKEIGVLRGLTGIEDVDILVDE